MSAEPQGPGRYLPQLLGLAGLGLLGAAWGLLGGRSRPEATIVAGSQASPAPLGHGAPAASALSAAAAPAPGSGLALVRENEPGALSRAGIAAFDGSGEPSASLEARVVLEKKLIEDRLSSLLSGSGASSEGAPSEDLSEVSGGGGALGEDGGAREGRPALKTQGAKGTGEASGGSGGYAAPSAGGAPARASRSVIPPSSPGGILLSRFSPPERQRLTGRLEAGDRLIPACRSSGLARQCVSAGQHCMQFDNCRGWLAAQVGVAGSASAAIGAGGAAATGAGAGLAAREAFAEGGASGKPVASSASGGKGPLNVAAKPPEEAPAEETPPADPAAAPAGRRPAKCPGGICRPRIEPVFRDPRELDVLPVRPRVIPPREGPTPTPLPVNPRPATGAFPDRSGKPGGKLQLQTE